MSAAELRTQINEYLQKVEDESFLKAVHSMLDTYLQEQEDPIEGHDIYGDPKRASELMEKYEAGLAAIERGEGISIDELEEKSKEWLSRTK